MPSYIYHGKKYTSKDTADEEIVSIPVRYIPQIVYSIEQQKDVNDWISVADWSQGYTDLCNVQWDMLMGGLQDLIESNNRIYRLIDTIHNGTVYSADGATPPIVTPAIPAAPPSDIGEAPGLRRQLLDAQGVLPAGWFGWGSAPATTADLVRALRNDSQDEIDRAKNAISLLQDASAGATIFDTVRGFLQGGAEVTAEGGILATLIVSTMAQSAMMGLQAGQLDDLLAKLDRLIEQLGVAAAPTAEATIAGELASVRDLLMPEEPS